MDKQVEMVQEAVKEKHNTTSNEIDLEPQKRPLNAESQPTQVASNETCTEQPSVQKKNNNTSSSENTSESDTTETKKQNVGNKSQPRQESAKKTSASEVGQKPKKAKQRLRKGKWTIEEEEYTSRIIQYFSTGLLTLPDGATLRSYLAEKLNCDPMRITKKFTGACCLGRRAYHLRDRPRASPAEIEMASFELLHLEQRFRLRVEHEQTGLPLPPRHELLASQPTPTATVVPSLFTLQQGNPAVKSVNHWVQNPAIASGPGHSSLLRGLTGVVPNATIPSPNTNISLQNPSLLLAAGQLLLQNQTARSQTSSSPAAAAATAQMLNNLVASYALSQAISQQHAGLSILQPPGSSATPTGSTAAPKDTIPSSSSPSGAFKFNAPTSAINELPQTPLVVQSQDQVSQHVPSNPQQQLDKIDSSTPLPPVSKKEEHAKKLKAQFEEQQKALRMAYEKSLRDAQEMDEKTTSSKTLQVLSETKVAKQTSDAKSTSNDSQTPSDMISPAEQLKRSYAAHVASLQKAEQEVALKAISTASSQNMGGERTKANENAGKKKSEQDKEAGEILLGFLHSLRESFEDAYENKNGNNVPAVVPNPSAQQGTSEPTTKNDIHSDTSKRNRRQKSDPITSLPPYQAAKRKVKPASVTETSSSTSSQPTIDKPSSSQEDSNSDKTGSCSSEDSDKEITASVRSSKGPPRKRLKSLSGPQEFTRENLMAHSKRMDMECGQSSDISSSDD